MDSRKKPVMRDGRNGGKLRSGGTKSPGRTPKLPELDALLAGVLGEEINGATAAEAILKMLRAKAAKGDIRAAEIILNRAYGKPKQNIAIENAEIEFKITKAVD